MASPLTTRNLSSWLLYAIWTQEVLSNQGRGQKWANETMKADVAATQCTTQTSTQTTHYPVFLHTTHYPDYPVFLHTTQYPVYASSSTQNPV